MHKHKETYRGYQIEVLQDTHPSNPRTSWDNLGTFYSRYGEANFSDINQGDIQSTLNWLDVNEYIYRVVYGHSHGGATIRTSAPFGCQFDSGIAGIIAVSKDKVRTEYGWKNITKERHNQILKYLDGEIETQDDYLTGNVWGYDVTKDGEDIASCWGYFGDYDNDDYGPITEAKSVIDHEIKTAYKDHIEQVKAWIKNRVPFIYRQTLSINP